MRCFQIFLLLILFSYIVNATNYETRITFTNTNVTYYCGDFNCDSTEDCSSCPVDCGSCPSGVSGGSTGLPQNTSSIFNPPTVNLVDYIERGDVNIIAEVQTDEIIQEKQSVVELHVIFLNKDLKDRRIIVNYYIVDTKTMEIVNILTEQLLIPTQYAKEETCVLYHGEIYNLPVCDVLGQCTECRYEITKLIPTEPLKEGKYSVHVAYSTSEYTAMASEEFEVVKPINFWPVVLGAVVVITLILGTLFWVKMKKFK
jgi:hypothetical protein